MPSQETRQPKSRSKAKPQSEHHDGSKSASRSGRTAGDRSTRLSADEAEDWVAGTQNESTQRTEPALLNTQVPNGERVNIAGPEDTGENGYPLPLGTVYNPVFLDDSASIAPDDTTETSDIRQLTQRVPFPDRSKILHHQHIPPTKNSRDRPSPATSKSNKGERGRSHTEQKASTRESTVPGYHPWSGNHNEDQLSEQVVKAGYFDKQLVLNEGNTARPSLWPHFKNKSGLNALSTFFVAVERRKQDRGHVTSPSTFKPPPRVTLTDAKREAWLRDLADDAVPLRRLSRTIPHGIRGKLLLDQCLSKRVPIARGIWLARCVGANEMRAFRRKGISGATTQDNEVRWIREWTVNVLQFVDDVINGAIQGECRSAVQYVLRLVTRFYAEQLLDRNEVLLWLLNRLDGCSLDKLPLFLLMTRIYWAPLMQSLQYTSRLARSCLKRLAEVPENEQCVRLVDVLVRNVRNLAVICPRSICTRYERFELRPLLARVAQRSEDWARVVLRHLILRNNRLECTANRQFTPNRPEVLTLVRLLDDQRLSLTPHELLSQCFTIRQDYREVVSILLNWVSSAYGGNISKAYTAARLVRLMQERGYDTDTAILSSLAHLRNAPNSQPELVSFVLNDLAREQLFDLGRYMRWLIATGALNNNNKAHRNHSWDVELLRNLSFTNAPLPSLNLRDTLLRRCGQSSKTEQTISSEAKRVIKETCFPLVTGPGAPERDASSLEHINSKNLAVSARTELGEWTLEAATKGIDAHKSKMGARADETDSMLSKLSVLRICAVLIRLGTYSCLEEFIELIVRSADMDMIFTVSQVFEAHCDAFLGAGSALGVLNAILNRYRSVRATFTPSKECVELLLRITKHISQDASAITFLNHDVFLCNQALGVAAFTPESETDVDMSVKSLQNNDDDFDQLVAMAHAMMDSHCFEQLFEAAMRRLESSQTVDDHSRILLQVLIRRLHAFDCEKLSDLANDWIKNQLRLPESSAIVRALPLLVDCGCLDLSRVTDVARVHIAEIFEGQRSLAALTAFRFLAVLLSANSTGHPESTSNTELEADNLYHFQVEQHRLQQEDPSAILHFLWWTLYLPQTSATSHVSEPALESLLHSAKLLEVLKVAEDRLCTLPFANLDLEELSNEPLVVARLRILINSLVDPTGVQDYKSLSNEDATRKIFDIVDALSLPYCRLALHFFASILPDRVDSDSGCSLVSSIAARAGLARDNVFWSELISALDVVKLREICIFTETSLLSNDPGPHVSSDDSQAGFVLVLRRFMNVVNTTMSSLSTESPAEIISGIVQQLVHLVQFVSKESDEQEMDSDHAYEVLESLSFDELQHWIQAILHLTMIHSRELLSDNGSCNAVVKDLCNLFWHGANKLSTDNGDYILDVVAYFATGLSDHVRMNLQTALGPVGQDPRLSFLLGQTTTTESAFHITSKSFHNESQNGTGLQQQPEPQPTCSSTPFHLRRWELLPETTSNIGANDTALNMKLFDARVG